MAEPGNDRAPSTAAESAGQGGGQSRIAAWQRFAAFLCFGMAVGAPAAQSLNALRFLPGSNVVEGLIALPVFVIGIVGLARIVLAPFVDAFDPPILKGLGRRRGWTALLTALLLALSAPILVMAPAGNPIGAPTGPVDIALMLAAVLVAGALLATVDGLRSVQPGRRWQGALATAQYLGTIVPAALLPVILRQPDSLTISIFLCVFITAAWLGLWLLPGREAPSPKLFQRPELEGLLRGEQNLSRGGKAITAWLYGMFICPIADFFRRFGRLAWAILAVLLLGDLATNLDTSQILQSNAVYLTSAHVTRIGAIRSVAQFGGTIVAAWLIWRVGAARGLAATFVLAGAAALSGLGAIAAAPSIPWFMTALAIGALAQGAILIGFVAFIARVTTPAFAAWQFSLLWLAGLPNSVIAELRDASNQMLSVNGTYLVFLVLLAAAIALTWRVAQRLDDALDQG
ncbi:MAG: hypothetical protein OEQ29_02820 [Alphaproteobacteria bacterium]|nr:hypothetical protein [Alphaproteobacteria bacterium]